MTDTKTGTSSQAPFTRVPRRARGYEPASVEEFLAAARAAFQGESSAMSSDIIRTASFPLVRGGFDVQAVDTALARLEDAFAQRERDQRIAAAGAETWVEQARAEAQELLARMSRPTGQRFDRVSWFRSGYSVAEVDAVTSRIARYFSHAEPLTVEQLRSAAFHAQRGGYREEQVDAVLDAAVSVILAVR
ncbi:DivIVA domain-containing protein [Microbacterium sp. G2-8]|uniref:DivIVA domain-containing protein n=1 Tax=Microbacterium sp. G2-8 TaxID=2842454 RepID=UPI001C8A6471|nr:DivIVA domain-containing protein [Microbacterium sp. G2-8]